MTQYARPDSDTSIGDWADNSSGTSNIYQAIDESSASDSDYIEAVLTTDEEEEENLPTTAKFGLSNVTDPESASNHIVRYRASAVIGEEDGSSPSLTVSLREGTTERAAVTNTSVSDSFTNYSLTLNSTQANNISNYNNLNLWVTVNSADADDDGIRISQMYFETPDAPAAAAADTEAFLLFID